jgi:hypothetical protein
MELGIYGPRNTKKPWKDKEAHLPDNLGLNIAQKSQQRTQEVEVQNPVQIYLGLQEQARVKWTPRIHPDFVLGHPPVHGKLMKLSTTSQKMGLRGASQGMAHLPNHHFGPSQVWRCIECSGRRF